MVKKHFKPYFFRINVLLLFTLLSFQKSESQELYIGSGGQFFLKSNIDFTTSSSLVSVVNNGEFILEAGSD